MNWLAVYERHLTEKKVNRQTAIAKIHSVKRFIAYCDNPRTATNAVIARYATKELAKIEPSTKSTYLINLKHFYKTCMGRDIEIANYVVGCQRRSLKKPIVVLEKDEVKQLWEAAGTYKTYFLIRTALLLGMMPAQIRGIKVKDVDVKNHQINFHFGIMSRPLKVSKQWVKDYLEYIEVTKPKSYLFEGMWEGKPLQPKSMGDNVKYAHKRSGLKKNVTFRVLRYSVCQFMLNRGLSEEQVMDALFLKGTGHFKRTLARITT